MGIGRRIRMMPYMQRTYGKILALFVAFSAIVTAAILGLSFYFSGSTIHELLTENHQLSKALRNLSHEEQIGYATLQRQERTELGERVNVLRFVQTAAGDSQQIVSEQLIRVVGEVAYFDALIVKFADARVQDGSERALPVAPGLR